MSKLKRTGKKPCKCRRLNKSFAGPVNCKKHLQICKEARVRVILSNHVVVVDNSFNVRRDERKKQKKMLKVREKVQFLMIRC
jgi:hypothetical protein